MSSALSALRLTDDEGLEVELLPFGATIRQIYFQGTKVTLSYPDPELYRENPVYLGSTVGRYANRIAKGEFIIDGRKYKLPLNNGSHHLHGGTSGWHQRDWQVLSQTTNSAVLYLCSPDGDNSYPGQVEVWQSIVVSAGELRFEYVAQSSKATPLNLTNHCYFNLSGNNQPIDQHQLQIFSQNYLPIDRYGIPTGEVRSVSDTVFDFSTPRRIGDALCWPSDELDQTNGFDHCFVWPQWKMANAPAKLASLFSDNTKIMLELWSDLPGLQFYTGNFLAEPFQPRLGLCLEAQYWPDSPNRPEFPSSIFAPDNRYKHLISYRFSKQ